MRFRIRWDGSNYYVSRPRYDGGEVVDAADFDKLVGALRNILQRSQLPDPTPADMSWVQQMAAAALDSVGEPVEKGSERRVGPNHKDDCDGKDWRYSGEGYNRVRACACGAEDHDPEPGSFDVGEFLTKKLTKFFRDAES